MNDPFWKSLLLSAAVITGACAFQPTSAWSRHAHPDGSPQYLPTRTRDWTGLRVLPDAMSDPTVLSFFKAMGTGAAGTGALLKAATPVVPDPQLLENKTAAADDLPPLDVWLSNGEEIAVSSTTKNDPETIDTNQAIPADSETEEEVFPTSVSNEAGLPPLDVWLSNGEEIAVSTTTINDPETIHTNQAIPADSETEEEVFPTSVSSEAEAPDTDISIPTVAISDEELSMLAAVDVRVKPTPRDTTIDSIGSIDTIVIDESIGIIDETSAEHEISSSARSTHQASSVSIDDAIENASYVAAPLELDVEDVFDILSKDAHDTTFNEPELNSVVSNDLEQHKDEDSQSTGIVMGEPVEEQTSDSIPTVVPISTASSDSSEEVQDTDQDPTMPSTTDAFLAEELDDYFPAVGPTLNESSDTGDQEESSDTDNKEEFSDTDNQVESSDTGNQVESSDIGNQVLTLEQQEEDSIPLWVVEEPGSQGSDLAADIPTLATTDAFDSAVSTSKEKEASLESLRAGYDAMVPVPKSANKGRRSKEDNPAKKELTKQFQENMHLISTLQDAPVTKETQVEALEIDDGIGMHDDDIEMQEYETEALDSFVDEEYDVARTELFPDPADTHQQLPLENREIRGIPSPLDHQSRTPAFLSNRSTSGSDQVYTSLRANVDEVYTSLLANADIENQSETKDSTYHQETTDETADERIFPTNATGEEFTEQIRQFIQTEAAKTTRELWRRNNNLKVLVGSASEVPSDASRTGSNVLFASREEAAEAELRDALSAKFLPRKPKGAKHKDTSSEVLVRLSKKPLEGRSSSAKLFRRPADAAREAAETSSVALSLGYSKLVKVSKRTSTNPLPIRSSRTTKVMCTVLLVMSCQRLLLPLIRGLLF